MPLLTSDDYLPKWPFRNGHLNTIYPALLRRDKKLPWRRERLTTPDNDFLDIDFLTGGHHRLVLLCHGLEGSSSSQYIFGNADLLSQNGWDVAAINYRSCSGEINRQARLYHSGATDDLGLVIDHLLEEYEQMALVGFSLGGNLVLKYAGERAETISPRIKSVVGISVPVDLSACSQRIKERSNWIYDKRFRLRLGEKMRLKHQQFPEVFPLEPLKKINTLWDFDNLYTSKIHGFEDAEDYYAKCNCLQFLPQLKVPALLINAWDDPLLSRSSFPEELARESTYFHLLATQYGGHCGYTSFGKRNYWEEYRVLEFLEAQA